MSRSPDLGLAISELRTVFAQMRRERAKLDWEDVRNNLNRQAAVMAYVRELRSQILLRADRIGIEYDAFIAILATDADEQRRLKRKPSARQMTVALRAERNRCLLRAEVTKDALAQAEAQHREALRMDAASCAACIAYTGYPS
ncbi:hypothetical protein [Sphingomonas sp. BE137]|uniref:hypothetical protein n=1 Tax=Sphingomonas sp. BE137 TaxID=2817844 RepID=UPI001AE5F397|nr:hypothetical protein [Sphingomonas sp. BE137]MDR6850160.1 hypothetical protein [Sphingomonas sp. BE137]